MKRIPEFFKLFIFIVLYCKSSWKNEILQHVPLVTYEHVDFVLWHMVVWLVPAAVQLDAAWASATATALGNYSAHCTVSAAAWCNRLVPRSGCSRRIASPFCRRWAGWVAVAPLSSSPRIRRWLADGWSIVAAAAVAPESWHSTRMLVVAMVVGTVVQLLIY